MGRCSLIHAGDYNILFVASGAQNALFYHHDHDGWCAFISLDLRKDCNKEKAGNHGRGSGTALALRNRMEL